MICSNITRQNGKTTRLILKIGSAILAGKNVLLITNSTQLGVFIHTQLINIFKTVGFVKTAGIKTAGVLDIVELGNLNLPGGLLRYQCVASDPGSLESHEWGQIAALLDKDFEILDELNLYPSNTQNSQANCLNQNKWIINSRDNQLY